MSEFAVEGKANMAMAVGHHKFIHSNFIHWLTARRLVSWLTRKGSVLDIAVVFSLMVSGLVIYGWNFQALGFYADDANFFAVLGNSTLGETLHQFQTYVPGRNLHILWQKLIFVLIGWHPNDLPWLHLFQSVCESTVTILLYFVLRKARLDRFSALLGSLVFAFWPTRNEVHFWISALPMNIFSTGFLLLFIYTTLSLIDIASAGRVREHSFLIVIDSLFFLCALFTYDQVVPTLSLVLSLRFVYISFTRRQDVGIWVAQLISLGVFGLCYLYLKLIYTRQFGGPSFSPDSIERVIPNLQSSMWPTFGGIDYVKNLPFWGEPLLGDQEVAVVATFGVIAIALLLILFKDSYRETPDTIKRNLWIALASILFFFSAYLPAYLWYMAPRHNYLPTAFIGVMVAALISIFRTLLSWNNSIAVVFWLFVMAMPLRDWYGLFAGNLLKSGNAWGSTYELKRNFYGDLIERKVFDERKRCVAIVDAPALYTITPFFVHEQYGRALAYLSNNDMRNMVLDCNTRISMKENCYDLHASVASVPEEVLVLRVAPFNENTDKRVRYDVIPQCVLPGG